VPLCFAGGTSPVTSLPLVGQEKTATTYQPGPTGLPPTPMSIQTEPANPKSVIVRVCGTLDFENAAEFMSICHKGINNVFPQFPSTQEARNALA